MSKINRGDSFGRLVVIGSEHKVRSSGAKKKLWVCSCECGSVISVETGNLNTGNTTQCNGCAILSRADHRRTHGYSNYSAVSEVKRKTYSTWRAMKSRCENPSVNGYKNYGGRGINVCDEWNDFECFLSDMGEPPTAGHSIDRVDNNKSYSKENCKWASRTEQANNKRNNRRITAFGETKNLNQWAESSGIKRETIARRINKGWSEERAVSECVNDPVYKYQTPLGKFNSLPNLAKEHNLATSTCYGRIKSKANTEWFEL